MSLIKRNSCRLASEILPAAVKISASRMSSFVVRSTSVAKAWRCLTAAWSNCLVRASGVWAKDRSVAWVISAAVVLEGTDDIAKARIRAYGGDRPGFDFARADYSRRQSHGLYD